MRSPLTRRGTRATPSPETAAPPHAERLNAARDPERASAASDDAGRPAWPRSSWASSRSAPHASSRRTAS